MVSTRVCVYQPVRQANTKSWCVYVRGFLPERGSEKINLADVYICLVKKTHCIKRFRSFGPKAKEKSHNLPLLNQQRDTKRCYRKLLGKTQPIQRTISLLCGKGPHPSISLSLSNDFISTLLTLLPITWRPSRSDTNVEHTNLAPHKCSSHNHFFNTVTHTDIVHLTPKTREAVGAVSVGGHKHPGGPHWSVTWLIWGASHTALHQTHPVAAAAPAHLCKQEAPGLSAIYMCHNLGCPPPLCLPTHLHACRHTHTE